MDHITFACLIGCTIYEPIFIKKCEQFFGKICPCFVKKPTCLPRLTLPIDNAPIKSQSTKIIRGTVETSDSKKTPLIENKFSSPTKLTPAGPSDKKCDEEGGNMNFLQ